jgi:hypothetical protein
MFRRDRKRSALFNPVVDNRQGLFTELKICFYDLLICSGNILLVRFDFLLKYFVETTKNPTSRDSAPQRIGDNFRKGACTRQENKSPALRMRLCSAHKW